MKTKGIIFDMDNTVLQSKIDFTSMKLETFDFLSSRGILPHGFNLAKHTTSTIIKEALATKRMEDNLIKDMWEIAKKFEILGMQDAALEPGALELLEELKGRYCIVIVTNNSVEAAEKALKDNGVIDYFDSVVGREMMGSLKPSPDGFLYVLDQYTHIKAEEWISIGDAWVDGKASQEAGIPFISYQGDIKRMNEMGVFPKAEIQELSELRKYI